ncbi:MAG: hypothetical protein E2O90_02150 [Alphaproteobacteria bacterium]|nr:hypothetical protein [Pseudomonadota bacterium]TDI67633.1 MAG: hypothetical protein E2O90_02150 [Alphaproteobacteria bacterium]
MGVDTLPEVVLALVKLAVILAIVIFFATVITYVTRQFVSRLRKGKGKIKSFWQWLKGIFDASWNFLEAF